MVSKTFKIALLGLLVMGGLIAAIWLRKDNERLRRRAMDERRQTEQVVRLRDESTRVRELVASTRRGEATVNDAMQSELANARREVATLEQRVEDRHAKDSAVVAARAANRDPEHGFVRLDNFQNAGRATPGGAFQTLVWAATKGDDRTLASLLSFDASARLKAEAMIAALPDSTRAKYPAPENLAALFIANVVTGHEAARVLEQDFRDGGHAALTIAFDGKPDGRPLPMQWGEGGWQFVVTDALMPEFERQLREASPQPAKK